MRRILHPAVKHAHAIRPLRFHVRRELLQCLLHLFVVPETRLLTRHSYLAEYRAPFFTRSTPCPKLARRRGTRGFATGKPEVRRGARMSAYRLGSEISSSRKDSENAQAQYSHGASKRFYIR